MRAAYECFRTGTQPDAIWAAIQDNGGHSSFYGLLYVGLWHEAHVGVGFFLVSHMRVGPRDRGTDGCGTAPVLFA